MADQDNPTTVTADDLIRRFCDQRALGFVANPGTTSRNGVGTSRGWCGYTGGKGDGMEVGFDDGYEFLFYLVDRGWEALPDEGNWPYRFYLATREADAWVLLEYCEADLTIRHFKDEQTYRAFCENLD